MLLVKSIAMLILLTICGCGQILNTEYKKGKLINEIPTGKIINIESKIKLELLSDTDIILYNLVTQAEQYDVFYQKEKVDTKADIDKTWLFISELFLRPVLTFSLIGPFMPEFNYWHWGMVDCNKQKSNTNNIEYCIKRSTPDISIIENETIGEFNNKNITTTKKFISNRNVSVYLSEVFLEDLKTDINGKASFNIEKCISFLEKDKDIELEFRYENEITNSKISYSDLKSMLEKLLPAYRDSGAKNKSYIDFIYAYKISNDINDLNAAKKYASDEISVSEVNKLITDYNKVIEFSKFEYAQNNGEIKKYLIEYPNGYYENYAKKILEDNDFEEAKKNNKLREFIKNYPSSSNAILAEKILKNESDKKIIEDNCHGNIIEMYNFMMYGNVFADKGKCVSIVAKKEQITSSTSGLFSMGNKIVFIEFNDTFRGYVTKGTAKLLGEYNYVTVGGLVNTVPHFYFLGELQDIKTW